MSPAADARLRLPGFRRYAIEMERLAAAASDAEEMRTRVASLEEEIAALRAARGFGRAGAAVEPDARWIERAKKFEYYWSSAEKKIDILTLRPFSAIVSRVLRDGRTFLNADRLYTLWQAAHRMPAAATAVAEVGVFKGGSSKLIAETMHVDGRSPRFYVCDTFAGHAEVNPDVDGRHRVGKQFRKIDAATVERYLQQYEFVRVMAGDIRTTSEALAAETSFGLVHIDVDVHEVTRFCLDFFAPRMAVGSTIVVDDYGVHTCRGVKQAVDEFVDANQDRFWAMHLLSAQAILVRVA